MKKVIAWIIVGIAISAVLAMFVFIFSKLPWRETLIVIGLVIFICMIPWAVEELKK